MNGMTPRMMAAKNMRKFVDAIGFTDIACQADGHDYDDDYLFGFTITRSTHRRFPVLMPGCSQDKLRTRALDRPRIYFDGNS